MNGLPVNLKFRRCKYKAWKKFCVTETAEALGIYTKESSMSFKFNKLAQKVYELKLAANIKKILKVSNVNIRKN